MTTLIYVSDQNERIIFGCEEVIECVWLVLGKLVMNRCDNYALTRQKAK